MSSFKARTSINFPGGACEVLVLHVIPVKEAVSEVLISNVIPVKEPVSELDMSSRGGLKADVAI